MSKDKDKAWDDYCTENGISPHTLPERDAWSAGWDARTEAREDEMRKNVMTQIRDEVTKQNEAEYKRGSQSKGS